MSDTNTPTATVTAGELLKEVQAETHANGKAKGKGGKKAGAKGKGEKAATDKADAPAVPEGPKVTLNPFKLPAPELKTVARKDITLDKQLQHRSKLQDLGDNGAVEHYATVYREALKAGLANPLPPVEVIEDTEDGTLWLYDGFQRLGAYQIEGVKEIPANVRKGTFADALMLSLSQNSENSVLPRTKDDMRRAVFALLDNAPVLACVLKAAKGQGGFHRTACRITGASMGTVANALAARGKKPKGDSLIDVKVKKEKKASEPKADPALSAPPAPVFTSELTPAQQLKNDKEAFEKIAQYAPDRLCAEAIRCVKRVAAILSAFATNDDLSTAARSAMSEAEMPIQSGFDKEAARDGKSFVPHLAMLEHWPVSSKLIEAFEMIDRQVKEDEAAKQEAARKAEEEKAAKAEAERAAKDKAAKEKAAAGK